MAKIQPRRRARPKTLKRQPVLGRRPRPQAYVSPAEKKLLANTIRRAIKSRTNVAGTYRRNIGSWELFEIETRSKTGRTKKVPVLARSFGSTSEGKELDAIDYKEAYKTLKKNRRLKKLGIRTLNIEPLNLGKLGTRKDSFVFLIQDPVIMGSTIQPCLEYKFPNKYLEFDWSQLRNGRELKQQYEKQARTLQTIEEREGSAETQETREAQKERTEYLVVNGRETPQTGDALINTFIKRSFHIVTDSNGNGKLAVLSPTYLHL